MTLVALVVVCVPHVVTPITVVRVDEVVGVLGRVHNLGATVGLFEQLCELPPCEVYFFMAIGGVLEHEI